MNTISGSGEHYEVPVSSDEAQRRQAVKELEASFIARGVSRFTAKAWAEAEATGPKIQIIKATA